VGATALSFGAADPGRAALFDAATGRWWTRGEVAAAVQTLAETLAAPEKRLVVLVCRNRAPVVIAYLAALEAGHAVALLGGAVNPAFRRDLVARYRPELVLAGPDDLDPDAVPTGYALDDAAAAPLRLWRRADGAQGPLHPDLAVLLPTSGSTGSPKLVRLSRASLEANARAIGATLDLDEGERPITSLPISYSYGLSVLSSHLCAGASVVLSGDTVVSPTFWDLVRAQRCTSLAGVPYTYQVLHRVGFENLVLPSLRTLTQAGGKLPDALVARFAAHMRAAGGRFFVMYGATEATARMACLPAGELPRKLGSAGRAIPGGRFAIDAGGALTDAPRTTGEVVYTGPNVMMGYATTREDLALGDVTGGCLRTGDLGYLDEEGYLFLTGRTSRFAKLFGLRLDLDAVEAILRRRSPAAVVGTDEKLVAFCELAPDADLDACRLELAAALAVPHRALELRRVAALPLTANGKVDYARLQRDAALDPAASAATV
jgi:acyl-CoA synthetase (AMP-forming)/AMP-acid ligase II